MAIGEIERIEKSYSFTSGEYKQGFVGGSEEVRGRGIPDGDRGGHRRDRLSREAFEALGERKAGAHPVTFFAFS